MPVSVTVAPLRNSPASRPLDASARMRSVPPSRARDRERDVVAGRLAGRGVDRAGDPHETALVALADRAGGARDRRGQGPGADRGEARRLPGRISTWPYGSAIVPRTSTMAPRAGSGTPSGSLTATPPVWSAIASSGGVPSRPASAMTTPRTSTTCADGRRPGRGDRQRSVRRRRDGEGEGLAVAVGWGVAVGAAEWGRRRAGSAWAARSASAWASAVGVGVGRRRRRRRRRGHGRRHRASASARGSWASRVARRRARRRRGRRRRGEVLGDRRGVDDEVRGVVVRVDRAPGRAARSPLDRAPRRRRRRRRPLDERAGRVAPADRVDRLRRRSAAARSRRRSRRTRPSRWRPRRPRRSPTRSRSAGGDPDRRSIEVAHDAFRVTVLPVLVTYATSRPARSIGLDAAFVSSTYSSDAEAPPVTTSATSSPVDAGHATTACAETPPGATAAGRRERRRPHGQDQDHRGQRRDPCTRHRGPPGGSSAAGDGWRHPRAAHLSAGSTGVDAAPSAATRYDAPAAPPVPRPAP